MLSIVTNQAVWSVSLSLTPVSSAKTAKPIEMPFGFWVWMGHPKELRVRWGPDPLMRSGNFGGKGRPL